MKILIVTQYYYPEQFQINEIAPELVRRGHQVTVLTGVPNYPQGVIYPGYDGTEHLDETIDGVHVIRVQNHPRGNGPINLIRNYTSFALKATKKARQLSGDFDVVFSYQLSPVTSIWPAITYARLHGVKHLSYCLDIWPESAKARMGIPGIYQIIGLISERLYRACDRILVTSRPFIDYLNRKNGIDKSKLFYLPQHADAAMLDMDLTEHHDGKVNFMYAGNMGLGQQLDVIIKAVAEFKHRDDFMVHMVGSGSQLEELKALSSQLGVANKFVFHGNQKREDMPAFYRMADALLITLRGNNAVGDTMPGKLQMYMTTGKPILGSINGAANEVIRESGCGKAVKADDFVGLAGLMIDFIEYQSKYIDCGNKAKDYYLEHFTLNAYMNGLDHHLSQLMED